MEHDRTDFEGVGAFFGVVVPAGLYIGYHFLNGTMASSYGRALALLSSLMVVAYQLGISLPLSRILRSAGREWLLFYFGGGAIVSLIFLMIFALLFTGGLLPVDWRLVAEIAIMGGASTLMFGVFRLPFRQRSINLAVEQDAATKNPTALMGRRLDWRRGSPIEASESTLSTVSILGVLICLPAEKNY